MAFMRYEAAAPIGSNPGVRGPDMLGTNRNQEPETKERIRKPLNNQRTTKTVKSDREREKRGSCVEATRKWKKVSSTRLSTEGGERVAISARCGEQLRRQGQRLLLHPTHVSSSGGREWVQRSSLGRWGRASWSKLQSHTKRCIKPLGKIMIILVLCFRCFRCFLAKLGPRTS